jgi:hypothetical protein
VFTLALQKITKNVGYKTPFWGRLVARDSSLRFKIDNYYKLNYKVNKSLLYNLVKKSKSLFKNKFEFILNSN